MNITWILTLAFIAGQLIKFPLGGSGPTLLDLTVLVLCLLEIIKIKINLKEPPLYIKAGLVFISVALLSLILTPLKLTIPEYLTSFLYVVRFFIFIFLGWLLYSGAFPNLAKNSLNILSISGIILAVLGLIQLVILPDLRFLKQFGWDPHYFRTVSTFLDPNFLGAYLVLTLILIHKSKKWFFAIVYLALLTTFSRGAYLAFLISFLTLAFLNRSLKLAIITIMLFLGLMVGFFSYQHQVAEPRGINRVESAQFRFSTWQQGWQLFQNHIGLGVGFNTYRYALRTYHLADMTFLQTHGSSTNDSSLLYVAATTGIIGLISYLIFLGSMFAYGVKINFSLAAGLLGLIAQSFFANTLFYPPILAWLILVAAISPSLANQKK